MQKNHILVQVVQESRCRVFYLGVQAERSADQARFVAAELDGLDLHYRKPRRGQGSRV